jgi:hypothetical protein
LLALPLKKEALLFNFAAAAAVAAVAAVASTVLSALVHYQHRNW